jgi:Kef-type K+ transport system membrane component KefB
MDIFLVTFLIILTFLLLGIVTKYLKFSLTLGIITSSLVTYPLIKSVNFDNNIINQIQNILIAVIFFGYTLFFKLNKNSSKDFFNPLINQISILVVMYTIFSFIGFETFESFFLATVVSLSSPILSVQSFINHKQETSRFSQLNSNSQIAQIIIIGFFLAVTSAIISLPDQFSTQQLSRETIVNILKISILSANAYLFARFILPKIMNLTKSKNLDAQGLDVLLIAVWGILIAYISNLVGVNYILGAMIAGVIIANSVNTSEVFNKFHSIGHILYAVLILIVVSKLDFNYFSEKPFLIFIVLVLVIVLKPLLNYILVKLQGLSKREGFIFSITNETISEISIILVLIVSVNNLVPKDFEQLVYIIYILSSIIFLFDRSLLEKKYALLKSKINFFEKSYKINPLSNPKKDFIILGANNLGYDILNDFTQIPGKLLLIDYDYSKLTSAQKSGYDTITIDLEDEESYDFIPWKDSKVIISCIDNDLVSQKIIQKIKNKKFQGYLILTSSNHFQAIDFYRQGIDYVFMKDSIIKYFTRNFVNLGNISKKDLLFEKTKHIEDLKVIYKKSK